MSTGLQPCGNGGWGAWGAWLALLRRVEQAAGCCCRSCPVGPDSAWGVSTAEVGLFTATDLAWVDRATRAHYCAPSWVPGGCGVQEVHSYKIAVRPERRRAFAQELQASTASAFEILTRCGTTGGRGWGFQVTFRKRTSNTSRLLPDSKHPS